MEYFLLVMDFSEFSLLYLIMICTYHVTMGYVYVRMLLLISAYASRATVAVLPGHRIKECIFLALHLFFFLMVTTDSMSVS